MALANSANIRIYAYQNSGANRTYGGGGGGQTANSSARVTLTVL
jgi:hypothetical protein